MAEWFGSIVVDIAKLRDYSLSDTHPRGRHKARVFRARLGLTAADAEWLRRKLLDAARDHPDKLRPTDADEYGQRFILDFELTTVGGNFPASEARTATIRSTWIVLAGQDVLRLTSCYVL